MIQMTEQEFQTLCLYIRRSFGLNMSRKQYLMESRLSVELERLKLSSYSDYWQRLRADASGELQQRLLELLTTNYSYFMRESRHFDLIQHTLLPALRQTEGKTLRLLCAGCAAGQEAYTLGMCLMDAKISGLLRIPFEIVGVDVSRKAIQAAEAAVYKQEEYNRLPKRWQELYCEGQDKQQFLVREKIRTHVRFYQHNLMNPIPDGKEVFWLAMCRNVLIYIQEPERKRMLEQIVDTIQPGGYLFVGHTESLMQDVKALRYLQPAVYQKEEPCKELKPMY